MDKEAGPTETPQVIDMSSFLKKVPPIEGEFSPPSEMKALHSAPKNERKEKVVEFKDKLVRQFLAIGLCRVAVEEALVDKPDMTTDQIMEIVHQFGEHYGFTSEHYEGAQHRAEKYVEARQKALETREKFPDDSDLIDHLTGVRLDSTEGEIKIEGCVVKIKTNKVNAKGIIENLGDRFTSMSLACYGFINGIHLIIIPEGTDIETTVSKVHEKQHASKRQETIATNASPEISPLARKVLEGGITGFIKHRILGKIFRFERNWEHELRNAFTKEKEPDLERLLLTEYLKLRRRQAYGQAADEILAIRMGESRVANRPGFSPESHRLFTKRDEGPYDYLATIRKFTPHKQKELYRELVDKLLIEEYETTIQRAMKAFDQLAQKSELTTATVVGIFMDKPLPKWEKVARRILQQQGKQFIDTQSTDPDIRVLLDSLRKQGF